jgi:FMN-dependent oxidoreductase (nitrilotriacetate monooxygenase family)
MACGHFHHLSDQRILMSNQPRRLHLNVNFGGAGVHPESWRSPEGRRFAAIDIDHYQEVARLAERGLLDAVFLADMLAPNADLKVAPKWALDPIVTASAMAVATTHVGFVVTISSTFNHPYNIARALLSLDHVSKGRIGLNIVTTFDNRAARNFGLKEIPTHDDRYARAADFIEVVLKLWDSWEDDALLADTTAGIWGDAARIHAIDHRGPYYSVAGPLQVPRSPQGRPVLLQAGSSPQGRVLGAQYAEAIFTVQQVLSEAQAYYTDIKTRARALGRNPDGLLILPGLNPVIGGSEAEAQARRKALDDLAEANGASLNFFAKRLGVDPADLDLDKPVPEKVLAKIRDDHRKIDEGSSKGFADASLAMASDHSLTVREIIDRGAGHRRIVGTPEQIADNIETWFTGRAADGFNVNADVFPSSLAAFVDHVIPVLQRRGLYRTSYEGTTLRQHFGLPRPENSFTEAETALPQEFEQLAAAS